MELLLKCAETALADACYRLIDLVDGVLKRHPCQAKPRRKLFSFYGLPGMSHRQLILKSDLKNASRLCNYRSE
jgi:hypothetical protein